MALSEVNHYYNKRPLIILESTRSWDTPNLQNSLLLETAQSEKYNTKHIQTSPFSATLLSSGTLSELERQLLSDLATHHAPSIAPEIRSGHNHS
jgi:hypothetical protein